MKIKAKRIMSMALALCLCLGMLPTVAMQAEAADSVSMMVSYAQNRVGKTGQQLGYTNQWCAFFVSDCAVYAGETSAIPYNGNAHTLYFAVLTAGGNVVSSPQAGDLVFYNCSVCDTTGDGISIMHVGLVENESYSLEGNLDGSSYLTSTVKRKALTASYSHGSGHSTSNYVKRIYVRPNYSGLTTHTADTSFGTDFTAYPKAKITAENIFNAYHSQIDSTSWIGTSDKCTIHEVYTDGCCKVTYPLDAGGTKTVYSKISLFNTHTHNYTGARVYQSAHPHEITQRCVDYATCGGWIYTGENYEVKTCEQCWHADFNIGASSVVVNVGESKTIPASITGCWPDTVTTGASFTPNNDVVKVSNSNYQLIFTGLKVGTTNLVMTVYSDSSKSHVIGSKTISITVTCSNHSYSYNVTTKPTTSSTGKLTGTCSKCSGKTTITLPKLNTTDYKYKLTESTTCITSGTGRFTWNTTTYGSFYFDVSIPATGHSYSTKVTTPTCTAQGYTTHTCSSCGNSYKDTYTNATGHSYSYKATKAPTTSAIGTLTGTCSKCKGTTSVTIPKLNTADYSYVVRTEPTYTSTGVGRYTWKTTTYGSFYFDVTLDKLTASGQIIVHNGVAAPGATVTLTVELKNNPGIAYLAVTPVYDASVLKLVSVENGDIIHDFDHDTNFSWSAAENSTANGVMMRLTFEIADNAAKGDYTVSLKFREAYNYDEQDVGFAVESGVITVSDILYGDANGDGVVNGKDVLLLRKYMANYDYDTGTSGITVHSGGDSNGDGVINGKDVLLMRKYMANYDYDTGTSTIVLGPSQ